MKVSMNMPRSSSPGDKVFPFRFLIITFMLLLVYFIYVAYHQGVANVYSKIAQNVMETWGAGQQVISDSNWNIAHESLTQALNHSPNNPEYLALMGSLYEWRVVGNELDLTEAAKNYEKALDYYQQALQLRPAFSFYWANVAVIKSRLGIIDNAFFTTVNRAIVLGSWEPGVQLKIADALLNVWYLLDEKSWKMMVTVIEKGLKSNAAQIMQIAKQVNVLNKLCGKLRRTDEMLQHCK